MNMKKYIVGLLIILGFSSCSDYLEKTSSTGLPSDQSITRVSDLYSAVNGVYYVMTGADDSQVRGIYAGDFAIFADLRGADYTYIDDNQQISAVSKYQVTATDNISLNSYERFYKAISRVNSILEVADAISDKDGNKDKFNTLKGELYALRALFHLDLARLYAQAPTAAADINAANSGIVLSTAVYPSSYIGTRSTLKETYDQIISDFNTSLPLLTKDKADGRINYWAALALRARAYLYLGDNTNALADADAVIKGNSGKKLYTRANYLEVWSKEYTDESLFEINVSETYNAQRNSVGYYTNPEGYAECGASKTLTDYLATLSGDIRTQLFKEMTDSQGDNKGVYSLKYPGRGGNLYVNNPKVIRLSEVYLIAAEAKVKGATGGDAAASYINALRQNRIENYSNVSAVTLNDILAERRIELTCEGHNAWDYWRNKMSVNKGGTVGEVKYNDYRTVLPFHISEIEVSKGLLIQNPQY